MAKKLGKMEMYRLMQAIRSKTFRLYTKGSCGTTIKDVETIDKLVLKWERKIGKV